MFQYRMLKAYYNVLKIKNKIAIPLIFDNNNSLYNPKNEEYRIVWRLQDKSGEGPWNPWIEWQNEADQEYLDPYERDYKFFKDYKCSFKTREQYFDTFPKDIRERLENNGFSLQPIKVREIREGKDQYLIKRRR